MAAEAGWGRAVAGGSGGAAAALTAAAAAAAVGRLKEVADRPGTQGTRAVLALHDADNVCVFEESPSQRIWSQRATVEHVQSERLRDWVSQYAYRHLHSTPTSGLVAGRPAPACGEATLSAIINGPRVRGAFRQVRSERHTRKYRAILRASTLAIL